jgi:hypothetical protein
VEKLPEKEKPTEDDKLQTRGTYIIPGQPAPKKPVLPQTPDSI